MVRQNPNRDHRQRIHQTLNPNDDIARLKEKGVEVYVVQDDLDDAVSPPADASPVPKSFAARRGGDFRSSNDRSGTGN